MRNRKQRIQASQLRCRVLNLEDNSLKSVAGQRRSGTRWSAKPQFDYYEPWSP